MVPTPDRPPKREREITSFYFDEELEGVEQASDHRTDMAKTALLQGFVPSHRSSSGTSVSSSCSMCPSSRCALDIHSLGALQRITPDREWPRKASFLASPTVTIPGTSRPVSALRERAHFTMRAKFEACLWIWEYKMLDFWRSWVEFRGLLGDFVYKPSRKV